MAITRKAKMAERASANRGQLDAMSKVASSIVGLKPAHEVVREDEAVPTIFPQFDFRVRLGGLPVSRICLVHGPSSEGKTPFVIGLGRSYLERDHFFNWIDAEHSTQASWMRTLLGPYYEHPGFTAPQNIRTYEDVRAGLRRWCEGIGEAREKGVIDKNTRGVAVIDSIRKLVPKALFDELSKMAAKAVGESAEKSGGRFNKGKPKKHIDGAGGRAAQIKAAFNSALVDEFIPLLAETQTSLVVIARETKEAAEGFFDQDTFKVGGGEALKYDSSLWLRITDKKLWDEVGGGEVELAGTRHEIQIERTKHGPRLASRAVAAYHTSNGARSPLGFDRARDVFELALELEVITLKGAHYSFETNKLGNGKPAALKGVREHVALIEAACRERFPKET